MKKVFFMAVALFTASVANAQDEPREHHGHHHHGPAPMEAAPSNGLKPATGSFTTEVAFCPFTNNSTSLENGRLNFAYSFADSWAVRAGLGFGLNKTEDGAGVESHTNTFSFAPGIVYSFEGTPKFNPYLGGELIFRTSKSETDDVTTSHVNGFGVQAFTGMNYYFSQNLYVGVEFGLGFNFSKDKETDAKTSKFAPYAQPAVRLGWAF